MAQAFSASTIQHAIPYWLEIVPYTQTVQLAAGSQQSLVPLIQGRGKTALCILEDVAATPAAGVQLQVTADQQQWRYDLGAWPGDLLPLPIRAVAFQRVQATLLNPAGNAAQTNLQTTVRMAVWAEPITVKILWGQPLTAQEQAIARELGLEQAAAAMRGTTPHSLDTYIETTYRNRLIDPVTPYSFRFQAATTSAPFYTEQVRSPNELLVLRRITVAAAFEDGLTLTVDRDNDAGHVVIQPQPGDLEHPIACFVPALDHLTFHLQAATAPAAPTPIVLEIWHVALSNILRARMQGSAAGLTLAQLQQIMGGNQAAATQVWDRVKAGVL